MAFISFSSKVKSIGNEVGGSKIEKAIFLDRDGVINPNIFNKATGQWESPHRADDFRLFPWTIECLKKISEQGYLLFLISNQPSYAKGKTSLENIKAIHDKFHAIVIQHDIHFTNYFYCYHHPKGAVPEYTKVCECRKPNPFFLIEAKNKYNIDMSKSWMIGDRDSDILCGKHAGVRTILINNIQEQKSGKSGNTNPDFKMNNLKEAVEIIVRL